MAKLNWHPPKIPTRTAIHHWAADHAAVVHEGATRRDGTRSPARPFVDVTIDETDLSEAMRENFDTTGDVVEAFDRTNYYLAGQIEQNIRSDRWEWDGVTKRRNGETVASPRSAVDTGELVESQTLEFR